MSAEVGKVKAMKRGDVLWATLAPRSGSEQSGRRPVVIVSHDGFNLTPTWNSLLVVPVTTSTLQAKRLPTIVLVPEGVGGLQQQSSVVCHQVTTLDRSKIGPLIGVLPSEYMTQIGDALKRAMELL